MSQIAYYRVSSSSQSIDAQRSALSNGKTFDKEFSDEGVSGAIPAAKRPAFAAMLDYVREGDTIHIYAIDRLGRDAIDVQQTIRALLAKGVTVDVRGLGQIAPGVGELIVAVLAQVADMERQRINERTETGRKLAKATFDATGKTHKGKDSLGRKRVLTEEAVRAFRGEGEGRKSISETAKEFEVSEATIKRYLNPRTRTKAS